MDQNSVLFLFSAQTIGHIYCMLVTFYVLRQKKCSIFVKMHDHIYFFIFHLFSDINKIYIFDQSFMLRFVIINSTAFSHLCKIVKNFSVKLNFGFLHFS